MEKKTKKLRKEFYLLPKTYESIIALQVEKNLKSPAATVEHIVEEYLRFRSESDTDTTETNLKKILMAINKIDRNTSLTLALQNNDANLSGIETFIDSESSPLRQARESYKKRIVKSKTRFESSGRKMPDDIQNIIVEDFI